MRFKAVLNLNAVFSLHNIYYRKLYIDYRFDPIIFNQRINSIIMSTSQKPNDLSISLGSLSLWTMLLFKARAFFLILFQLSFFAPVTCHKP